MLYLISITELLVICGYPVLYELYQNYKLKKAGKLWLPPKGVLVLVWSMFSIVVLAAWMIWRIPAIYPEYVGSTDIRSSYTYGIGGDMQISSVSVVDKVDNLQDYLAQKDYRRVECDRLEVYTMVENHRAEIIIVGDFEYKKGNRSVLHISPTRHIEKEYDYSVDESGILLRMEFSCYEEERDPIIIVFREKTLNGYTDYTYEFQDVKDGEKLNLELTQNKIEKKVVLLPIDELIRKKDDFSDIEVGITLHFYNGSDFIVEAKDDEGNEVDPEDILVVSANCAYSTYLRGTDKSYKVYFSADFGLQSYAGINEEETIQDEEKRKMTFDVLDETDIRQFPEKYNSLTRTFSYYHVPSELQSKVIDEIIETGAVTLRFVNNQTKDERRVIIGLRQIVEGNYKGIWMK